MFYFVALAEELNYQRAAGRLGISGAALSVQVKQLEEIVGVRLCERSTSSPVRLTAAGRVFLRKSRRMLALLQDMVDAMKKAGELARPCRARKGGRSTAQPAL